LTLHWKNTLELMVNFLLSDLSYDDRRIWFEVGSETKELT